MQTINIAYKHLNHNNEDGTKLSLGKFILVHCIRDLNRMFEAAAAVIDEEAARSADIEAEITNDNNADGGEIPDEEI